MSLNLKADTHMKVTIYDIAKETGTSASTVSRALNSSSLISNEKTLEILDVAKKLGYQKRSISKQRGRAVINIKLILGQLNNPKLPLFYSVPELVSGLKKGIPGNQLNVICETETDVKSLFNNKKAGDTHAVIFAFTSVPAKLKKYLDKKGIPYLVLNRAPKADDFIAYNNEECMKKLVESALSKRPNARPVFLELNHNQEVTVERRNGYQAACEHADVKADIHTLKDVDQINASLVKKLNKKGYNCIICMNDIIAATFMIRAFDQGFHFPKDFSITGFDGSSVTNILPCTLETMSLEVMDIGRKAGEWVNERVISRDDSKFQFRINGRHIKGDTV